MTLKTSGTYLTYVSVRTRNYRGYGLLLTSELGSIEPILGISCRQNDTRRGVGSTWKRTTS